MEAHILLAGFMQPVVQFHSYSFGVTNRAGFTSYYAIGKIHFWSPLCILIYYDDNHPLFSVIEDSM